LNQIQEWGGIQGLEKSLSTSIKVTKSIILERKKRLARHTNQKNLSLWRKQTNHKANQNTLANGKH
jgi:hypothetical protein